MKVQIAKIGKNKILFIGKGQTERLFSSSLILSSCEWGEIGIYEINLIVSIVVTTSSMSMLND